MIRMILLLRTDSAVSSLWVLTKVAGPSRSWNLLTSRSSQTARSYRQFLLLQQLTRYTPLTIQAPLTVRQPLLATHTVRSMRRLRQSNTERQAARPVWMNTASLLRRARSAPASATTLTPSLTLDEGRGVVSRETANLAEQWRRAPPVSQRFEKQVIVQNLLTRQRQGAASFSAVAAPTRKRSRTHDEFHEALSLALTGQGFILVPLVASSCNVLRLSNCRACSLSESM